MCQGNGEVIATHPFFFILLIKMFEPMRFSRLVKCGRIHIENTNERLSR